MVMRPRTTTVALTVLVSTLFACKMFKKGEEEQLPEVPSATAVPTATQAATPPPTGEPAAPTAQLKLGDVKRFADKEKKSEGVVKVLEADTKVFNEPDIKTQHVAELNKNIFVSRLATLDDFVLVEFPSGVGELSPGWVQAKFLSEPDAKVSEEKVKAQEAAVKVVTNKPATTTTTTTSTTGAAAGAAATTGGAAATTGGAAATTGGAAATTGAAAAATTEATSTTGAPVRIKRKKF
jgi:hypothetical protein